MAVDDGVRYWAAAGDVIVMPYGDHYMHGRRGTGAECVSILSLLDPLPWAVIPVLRHGGGGRRTEVVCGYMHSTDPLFDPSMRALPPVFVVRLPDGPAAGWVQASIDYALADAAPPSNRAPSAIATRLPELVLIRGPPCPSGDAHQPSTTGGSPPCTIPSWRRRSPRCTRIPPGAGPSPRWPTDVAASRSSLDDRFRQVLGQSPIRYLTAWRMHLANDLLATTELSVFTIARRVGYDAEEAFSRAFKRERGVSPSTWRATTRRERREIPAT